MKATYKEFKEVERLFNRKTKKSLAFQKRIDEFESSPKISIRISSGKPREVKK